LVQHPFAFFLAYLLFWATVVSASVRSAELSKSEMVMIDDVSCVSSSLFWTLPLLENRSFVVLFAM
jgi:hypothetical protein